MQALTRNPSVPRGPTGPCGPGIPGGPLQKRHEITIVSWFY